MMNAIERRLAKVEAQTGTAPEDANLTLLIQPSEDAPREEWTQFRQDKAAAGAKARVIVFVSPGDPR